MKRTPLRLKFLRRAAFKDPEIGYTDSSVLTDLINARLIACVGIRDYRLTRAGETLLRQWERDSQPSATIAEQDSPKDV